MATEFTNAAGMAGRYASALYDLAAERNSIEPVAANLRKFQTLLDESAELRALASSPAYPATQQIKALDALFAKTGIDGLTANFIKLVAQKRRLSAISAMIGAFGRLVDAAKGVIRVEAVAAQPLSEQQIQALKETLAKTGAGAVDVSIKIDPSLIGGLIVRLGSRMIDDSVKTKLNAIRTRMKEVG